VHLGGGFGRRPTSQDFVRQAVQIVQPMPGTPVMLIWSREEDEAQGSSPDHLESGRAAAGAEAHQRLLQPLRPDYGITVAGVCQPADGMLVDVEGAGGTSPLAADPSQRRLEADYARSWFATIAAETFGWLPAFLAPTLVLARTPAPSPVLETDLVTTAFWAISRARFGNRRRPERLFPVSGGGPTMDSTHGREEELRELARRLYFRVERTGDRFSICREAGVEQPVRHDGLTLEEAEEVLNKWKLRGFHGG
jgi:hypothetical protein